MPTTKGGKGFGKGGAKVHRKILRDNIDGLSEGAIQRIGFTAGVVSMSGEIKHEVRTIVTDILNVIVLHASEITSNEKRVRVTSEDIEEAIRIAHEKTPFLARVLRSGDEGDVKRCPVGKCNTTERKLNYYQKQSGCVHFSRTAFDCVVREVSRDYKTDMQFSKDAIGILQLTVEAYLVRLLSAANQLVVHADRKTLMPKDLIAARTIGNDA